MDVFAHIAEQKIREAIRRGELDNLALRGQPIPVDHLCDVPEELRMGYKILKNAGFLPEELELRRELTTLEDLLASCSEPEEKERLRRRLSLKRLHYDVLMEKSRSNPSLRLYSGRLKARFGL